MASDSEAQTKLWSGSLALRAMTEAAEVLAPPYSFPATPASAKVAMPL